MGSASLRRCWHGLVIYGQLVHFLHIRHSIPDRRILLTPLRMLPARAAPCKGGQQDMQKGVHHNEEGDTFAFYQSSLAETTTAAKKSLQQLGMEYDAQTIDTPSRIVIEGMSVDHTIVKVTLEGINQDQTKATIHANYYGEKTLSLRFQHLLEKELKVSASQVPDR